MNHYREENLRKEESISRMRMVNLLVGLSTLLFISLLVSLNLRARNKLNKERIRCVDLARSFENLESDYRAELDRVQTLLEKTYGRHFSFLRDLLVYDPDTDDIDMNRTRRRLDGLIDSLRTMSGKDSEFEKSIDFEIDNFMTRLRAAMPKFAETDFRLLSYVAVGFKTTLIASLLGVEKSAVYNQKSRLIKRIQKSAADDRDFLLSVLT